MYYGGEEDCGTWHGKLQDMNLKPNPGIGKKAHSLATRNLAGTKEAKSYPPWLWWSLQPPRPTE